MNNFKPSWGNRRYGSTRQHNIATVPRAALCLLIKSGANLPLPQISLVRQRSNFEQSPFPRHDAFAHLADAPKRGGWLPANSLRAAASKLLGARLLGPRRALKRGPRAGLGRGSPSAESPALAKQIPWNSHSHPLVWPDKVPTTFYLPL